MNHADASALTTVIQALTENVLQEVRQAVKDERESYRKGTRFVHNTNCCEAFTSLVAFFKENANRTAGDEVAPLRLALRWRNKTILYCRFCGTDVTQ